MNEIIASTTKTTIPPINPQKNTSTELRSMAKANVQKSPARSALKITARSRITPYTIPMPKEMYQEYCLVVI